MAMVIAFDTLAHNNIDIGNNGGTGVITATTLSVSAIQGAELATPACIGNIRGVRRQELPVSSIHDGQLGRVLSSRRFKEEIKPMDKASEAILALKPVTFRYKNELDPNVHPQFGLIAEEVAKVNPDLVVRDKDGETYTVRYEAVNAMLLNEFLKEHRTVKIEATLEQSNGQSRSSSRTQQKQIEALTAGLQKVSAQLEASKPAPQVVNNP